MISGKSGFWYIKLTPIHLSDIEQNRVISSSVRLHGEDGNIQLRLLYTKEKIASSVKRLAEEISRDYSGKELLLVVVLKGAFVFAADLVRMLTVPVEVDFVKLKSYQGKESSGRVIITRDLEACVEGRHLLVVEDIIDTGISLEFLNRHLSDRGPRSLRVCTLIDKVERRKIAIEADYAGIVSKGGFLVGYGLDLDESCRELDAIYEVTEYLSPEV